ncbi:MAG: BamA/TamA family outer membrane protein [Chlorobi bacterium]|nr:BamA/TamA family outer membrane protein [Chlorobiota bacterium]
MRKIRIPLVIFLVFSLGSCNIYRVVPPGKYLLRKNELVYKEKEVVKPSKARAYIVQQPNFYVAGYPVLVGIYSIADPHPELTFDMSVRRHPKLYKTLEKIFSAKQAYYQLKRYYVNLNNQIKAFGEEPVIIDSNLTEKSRQNLHMLFKNYGFLDNETSFEIRPVSPIKAIVRYTIVEHDRYLIDSVRWHIASEYPRLLFNRVRHKLKTRNGIYYMRDYLWEDREFLTEYFRNNGLYDFQSSYITYDVVKKRIKPHLNVYGHIYNKIVYAPDTVYEKPFLPYKYRKVDVVVAGGRKTDSIRPQKTVVYDSIEYKFATSRYFKPHLLHEAILLRPGRLYADKNVNLTRKQLYFLDNFRQVYISHFKVNDTLLDGRVLLVPLKKFSIKSSANITHSSIRPLGISGELSFTWRNLFNGFENLRLSGMINQAASTQFAARPSERFFNTGEVAVDLSLYIPRFVIPFFKRYVPLFMHPKTIYSVRYNAQTNIGLDREKLYAINSYEWKPSKPVKNVFTPMEVNYVNYKNPERYFEIYTTAFNTLKALAEQYYHIELTPDRALQFIRYVLTHEPPDSEIYQEVKKIEERRIRLTENVFIINTNHTLTYDTRKDIWDNHFYFFRIYLEVAGWLPGAISKLVDMPRNAVGQRTINRVPYAQYYKGEFTFIRHWDFGKKRILAYRFFTGLAIPYGNSTNIPFVAAYFAGGSNDIRAWRAFELGPGSTGGLGEFNEANFKLLTNLEYRMPIYENHHIGLFVDAGNIWNVFDDTPYPEAKFKGLYSLLHETAIGAGIGYRYDFSFFAIRLDWAFKLFDPARPPGERWLPLSIENSVLQFGINYPF